MSQTLNNAYGEENNNYPLLFETVEKLYRSAKIGIAFNFVTNRGSYQREGNAYHDPIRVMEFAYTLSNNVIMDNSCFPYEATCTILRGEIADNNMIFGNYMNTYKKEFEEGLFVVKHK